MSKDTTLGQTREFDARSRLWTSRARPGAAARRSVSCAADDYEEFLEQFGKLLKLGFHENSKDRVEVAKLLREHTFRSGVEQIGLK
eukprot:5907610-Heterocapsa_arctica.AAC.1